MLYLVATPIGNLKDITLRALETLKDSDYILAEDTRKSSILLNHYKIKKKMIPFHKFNERSKEKKILNDLKEGKNISLISEAGTPLICDPGYNLIKSCIKNDIKVFSIPGPCSIISSLIASGSKILPFQFIGFLPKKKFEKEIYKILNYEGTTISFESPKRIVKTLEKILKIAPDMDLIIAKEITKKFEEFLRGTPEKLLKHFLEKKPKGEMILIFKK